MTNNPWKDVTENSRRRAVIDDDIFWIKDSNGDYGVFLEFYVDNEDTGYNFTLHNIDIVKTYNSVTHLFKWQLLLKNRDQWPIFKVLCQDLIAAASQSDEHTSKIRLIENRLKHWQELLKNRSQMSLSIEVQMGIYAELYFLKNILMNKVSSKEAIYSWYGPDQDKQDFVLEQSSYEIKSYRSTKGERVYISSKEQLDSVKEHAYLIAMGLTIKEELDNISTLCKEIEHLLSERQQTDLIDLLYLKLFQVGYLPQLYEDNMLKNFKVDKLTFYEIREDFPRIIPPDVKPEIVSLSYQIDLTQCSKWKTELENIFF